MPIYKFPMRYYICENTHAHITYIIYGHTCVNFFLKVTQNNSKSLETIVFDKIKLNELNWFQKLVSFFFSES